MQDMMKKSSGKTTNSAADSKRGSAEARPSKAAAEEAVRVLLRYMGENPQREGLVQTPQRVIRSYAELFSGYEQSPEAILGTVFEEVSGYDAPVLVRNIPFYSHCEHHMVPIIGKAHIAYAPSKGVVGLSKLARLVEIYGRRLQTQENLTAQIADALQQFLQPRGVAVLVEAEHLCMSMRGVQKQGSTTSTSAYRGVYVEDAALRSEFLRMVGLR